MTTLWEIESDFIRQIASIKRRGIRIDTEFSRAKVIEGTRILNEISGRLGWNPGSPTQLGNYLIKELGLPVLKRTPAGKPCFDKFVLPEYEMMLEATGDHTANEVLVYRGWQKTTSSNHQAYLDLMDENQILHPNYKVHGTRTGRLSCEKPNLQQIPRNSVKPWNGDVKKAFIPRGYELYTTIDGNEIYRPRREFSGPIRFFSFDFKQVEFRLAAAAAREFELLEIFNSGEDIFTTMSNRWMRDRNIIKTLVYATLYNAGKSKIGLIMKMPQAEAAELYDEFHGTWPGFKRVAKQAELAAKRDGYIQYWSGRRRHLTRDEAHKAFNAWIQGGAFEIIKRRMLALDPSDPIVLQVHDDVTFEADDNLDLDRIKKTLEAVPEANELGVKFEVDLKVWGI